MKLKYKSLGEYIREVNNRDSDLKVNLLLGVSIQKKFMPSIANIIGTDMSTYKIVKKNQFAYGPVTSRNGDKISIALLEEHDESIVSQMYTPFEVIDKNRLLPEYLMMWFRRPEFDRYARFMSHGSAREIFSWEEMCNTEMPIPDIDTQKEIVKEYNVLVNRISINKQLIKQLEVTCQAIYSHWFVDFEFPDKNGKPYKSNGGEMEYNKLLDRDIPKGWEVKNLGELCEIKGGKRLPKGEALNNENDGNPYIKVADMCDSKFIALNNKFQFVDDNLQGKISRYIVSKGDLLISIVGTIGLLNIVHKSLDKANLSENCMKMTNFKKINADYIYHFLLSREGQQIIETKTVGGVQGKLPMYNIQSIPVICPSENLLLKFERLMSGLNSSLEIKTIQSAKLSLIVDLLFAKLSKQEK